MNVKRVVKVIPAVGVAAWLIMGNTGCGGGGGAGPQETYTHRLKTLASIYQCHGVFQDGDKGSLAHPKGNMRAEDLDHYTTVPPKSINGERVDLVRVAFCKI